MRSPLSCWISALFVLIVKYATPAKDDNQTTEVDSSAADALGDALSADAPAADAHSVDAQPADSAAVDAGSGAAVACTAASDCPATGSPCIAAVCLPAGTCANLTVDGLLCDDGLPCTVGDKCVAGKCTAGQHRTDPRSLAPFSRTSARIASHATMLACARTDPNPSRA